MTESGLPYKKLKPKQPPDEVGIHSPSPDIHEQAKRRLKSNQH